MVIIRMNDHECEIITVCMYMFGKQCFMFATSSDRLQFLITNRVVLEKWAFDCVFVSLLGFHSDLSLVMIEYSEGKTLRRIKDGILKMLSNVLSFFYLFPFLLVPLSQIPRPNISLRFSLKIRRPVNFV